MSQSTAIPPRLQAIIEEFQACDRSEKLELMLEYADRLPPLPAQLEGHSGMEQVHECMSPVFLQAELIDHAIVFYIDVPPEAPTVRGYAALLMEGLAGATPQMVLAVPNDFFQAMGLHQVLSPQRLHGISALLAYMKRQALALKGAKARGGEEA
ncbi:SufE family protein [Candidatus Viridilinea mediisalina]|uniref:Cysteine desulfuration protein SufE n=1 Tax=Candidatus Viridilinea mediisalina TaxID=2024553 RepID=A0A2A6RHS2_9CHLR|nr:SufE family protein [Candidatus Viridilinea mediisalina]PDW02627.1 cysteine desulfuration protein SufE [Candidatus Viridilinea mediisalina]